MILIGEYAMNKELHEEIPSLQVNISEEGKKFILENIENVIDSKTGWTDDKYVKKFEKEFGAFENAPYTVAVSTGLAAIEAIIVAMGLANKGYIAYVPTLTAPPTPVACLETGLRVVFVDCDKNDLGMDVEDLKAKIEKYPTEKGVVITVHMTGIISSHIDEIVKIAHDHGLKVIEDCAHAHGAEFEDIKAGLRGDAGAFSFFMTKVLMSGEGGAIVTKDKELYEKCSIARNYGKVKGLYQCQGSNWRMSEFNAVTALWQAKSASGILSERRHIAKVYDELLENNEHFHPIKVDTKGKSSYYKYVVMMNENIDRELLKQKMKNEYKVTLSGETYKRCCHQELVFKNDERVLNLEDKFANGEYMADNHICLPIYPGLKDEQLKYIIDSLNLCI